MEKKTFLNTWKDIPAANEIQHTIEGVECTSDGISTKMAQNNVSFTFKFLGVEGDYFHQYHRFIDCTIHVRIYFRRSL